MTDGMTLIADCATRQSKCLKLRRLALKARRRSTVRC